MAREDARAEDDGYPLSLWWNRATGLSELLIHATADLRRTPLCRVKLPSRAPFGFHGNWADQRTLDSAVAAHRAGEWTGPTAPVRSSTAGRDGAAHRHPPATPRAGAATS